MVKKMIVAHLIPMLLSGAVLAGCGSGKSSVPADSPQESGKPKEPITLTIFNGQPGAFDFDKLGITESIKAKFPYITFKIINRGQGSDYPDLVAAGTLPDIIYESAAFTVERVMQYNLQYDMQELVKKYNLNLDRFEPNVLAQTRSANSEMKLYGLPFTMNRYALFYNKDVFDKFGVGYPKDGMTWDDVYELAKKLTRVEGADTYQGFTAVPNNMMLNNQLSLSPLDPKEDKATMNNEGWKTLYENLKRFFVIPNAQILPTTDFSKGKIAMAIDPHPSIMTWTKANPALNWDMASLPSLKEKPKTGFKPATLALFVSQTSKYKDDAFQVVAALVSDEIQTITSKRGVGTPLISTSVRQAFGQEVPEIKGKNVNALYYYPDAPPSPPRAANLTNVSVNFGNSFTELVAKQTDINTVLRQFDEEINQNIAKTKSDTGKK